MQNKKLTFSEWIESEDGYEMANGQLATVRLLNANMMAIVRNKPTLADFAF
jgi:hypothetical protein